MSRVGKLPIDLPSGVTVDVTPAQITVSGSQGKLETHNHDQVTVEVKDGKILVQPANDSQVARAMWGTMRATLSNLVTGASKGFTKRLELQGVGYRAAIDGSNMLTLFLGYSHEIKYAVPQGIKIVCEKPTSISISGASKQMVGQVAAEIRSFREPEPYKGKGVRFEGERIRMKEGKKK